MARGWPAGLSKSEYKFYKEQCIENLQEFLGAYEYRDAREKGEIQPPVGFIPPAPKPEAVKKSKPSSVNSSNSDFSDTNTNTNTDTDADDGEDDNSSAVIVADDDGYWGFTITKRDMPVYRREKFKYDESFVVGNDEGGNPIIKEFKAGDWRDWKSTGCYFGKFENMFNYIKSEMHKTDIKNRGKMDMFVESLKRSEERVLKAIGVYKDKK